MYQKALDSYLQQSVPQAVLLYGEGSFWIDWYSKKIAPLITQDKENITTFYFGEYDYAQVHNLINQSSLFGDCTLVILKIDKKIGKKELSGFLASLEKNPSNALIIEFYQGDSRSDGDYARDYKEMASVFGACKNPSFIEVRFFEPSLSDGQRLLGMRAKELGIEADMRILTMLLNLQNNDVGIALKELEKFIYLSHPLSEKDILELSSSLGSVEVEDLIASLLQRRNVLELFAKLEEEGLDEMQLMGAIGNHFYRLFMVFCSMRIYGKVDCVEVFGYKMPPYILEGMMREASSLREGQYKMVFEVLAQWRIDIFAGKGKASNAIVALNKIQAILR